MALSLLKLRAFKSTKRLTIMHTVSHITELHTEPK